MEILNDIVNNINYFLWTYVVIIALIGSGIFYTLRTKFVQLRLIKEMFRLILSSAGDTTVGKEISGFQAFCVSTAARVGVGNIAGVAIAIVMGGAGAIFWMWVVAFIGCATGFVESTLAQIYKLPKEDGGFYGGPAYYICNTLHMENLAKLFAVLILCTFGFICAAVQTNTIVNAFETAFNINHVVTGFVVATLTAMTIFGGAHRVAKFTEMIVPSMAGFYLISVLIVAIINIDKVPGMFAMIIHDAFTPQAAVGGGFATVLMTGVRRGLFSNEAGEGTVPNAAATANANHPVRQGLIQAAGVYVDTIIVCSATAFAVLLSEQYVIGGNLTGVSLVQISLAGVYGDYAMQVLAVIVFMFALSSIIGNYYYGEINIEFLKCVDSDRNDGIFYRHGMNIFRVGVIAMVLFGAFAELNFIWDLSDLFMAMLAVTNLYAIAQLSKYVFIALDDYISQKKRGIKEPVFNPNIIPNKDGIFAWGIDKTKK
ncbi:MAG: sodium:alanine symporter family protein [Selenomonadaceae bacterium]|nr:sodium:alanine symporter family protein [Selenomonadaceae bacterium]